MPLSDEQLNHYRDQGFVNAGQLFKHDELTRMAVEFDRLVNFDEQVLGNKEDGVFPYRAMLNFRSPDLADFILHPAFVEVARQILGEDIRFWWDQGINKAPGSGSPIAWHQDNGYQDGRTQEFLTCWLALDASSIKNGGLEVIPGSAAKGPREHEWQGVHAVIPEPLLPEGVPTPLDAKAGDLLFFSSRLVHRTGGNSSRGDQRRAWVVQYCRADHVNEITGESYDNRPWVLRDGEYAKTLTSERPFDLGRERP